MTESMDDEYSFPLFMMGSATTYPPEPETDAERRLLELREVVYEITGIPVEQPPKQRIGFLP